MLWENINYLAEISYLPNTLIYEYDISKANINVLYSKGVIDKKTYDLHKEPIFENNIETEHEKMFSEQGIKIKALIAKCRFGDSSV